MRNAHDEKVIAELEPALQDAVRSILAHVNHPSKLPPGVELHAHTGYRSPAEQLAAFKAGNSKLKRGKHNYRPARACDLVFTVHGKWSWDEHLPYWYIGYWAESAGVNWGGRWGTPQSERHIGARAGMRLGWDPCHVELG